MAEPTDPIERSELLDRKILAIPEDAFLGLQRRMKVLIALVLLAMGAGAVAVILTTSSTRRTVQGEVVPILEDEVAILEERNAELEAVNAASEDITRQQTDAIVLLLGILEENQIEAPEIIIRATTTTTTTEDPDG